MGDCFGIARPARFLRFLASGCPASRQSTPGDDDMLVASMRPSVALAAADACLTLRPGRGAGIRSGEIVDFASPRQPGGL